MEDRSQDAVLANKIESRVQNPTLAVGDHVSERYHSRLSIGDDENCGQREPFEPPQIRCELRPHEISDTLFASIKLDRERSMGERKDRVGNDPVGPPQPRHFPTRKKVTE